jgi:hypothetical protein
VWTRNIVNNAMVKEIFVETMIFATPIGLHTFNFCIKEKFNMFLKAKKSVLNIGFGMKKICLSEFCEVIDEVNIVFETANRGNCRTPNIGINEL